MNLTFSFHFQQYVPIDVLRLLKSKREIAKLGVSKADVTTMFCDIEGFSILTETVNPETLVTVLTEAMDLITACIEETGGLVDKFIGDEAMAFWGPPGDTNDCPKRACLSAINIRSRLIDAQKSWESRGLPILNCWIGIASGNGLIGNFGSSKRFSYTAIGSPVNLASRLKVINKTFQTRVLISSTTAE